MRNTYESRVNVIFNGQPMIHQGNQMYRLCGIWNRDKHCNVPFSLDTFLNFFKVLYPLWCVYRLALTKQPMKKKFSLKTVTLAKCEWSQVVPQGQFLLCLPSIFLVFFLNFIFKTLRPCQKRSICWWIRNFGQTSQETASTHSAWVSKNN